MGADALDAPSDLDHPRCEPADDVEPVQDMGGMTQMGADRRPIRPGPVRDDDLDSFEPAVSLGDEEPGEGSLIAVRDDPECLAGARRLVFTWIRKLGGVPAGSEAHQEMTSNAVATIRAALSSASLPRIPLIRLFKPGSPPSS